MLQYTGRGITAHRRAVQFEDWYAAFRWNRQQADVHAQNVQAVKRDERMAVFSVVRNWMCLGYAQQDSAGALSILFWTDVSAWDSVLGMIPGSSLLILSKLTEGKLGRGDGLYLIILGGCFGIRSGCLTLFSGIFLAALFSAAGIFSGRIHFKSRLPLIPFLFLGFEMLKLF